MRRPGWGNGAAHTTYEYNMACGVFTAKEHENVSFWLCTPTHNLWHECYSVSHQRATHPRRPRFITFWYTLFVLGCLGVWAWMMQSRNWLTAQRTHWNQWLLFFRSHNFQLTERMLESLSNAEHVRGCRIAWWRTRLIEIEKKKKRNKNENKTRKRRIKEEQ